MLILIVADAAVEEGEQDRARLPWLPHLCTLRPLPQARRQLRSWRPHPGSFRGCSARRSHNRRRRPPSTLRISVCAVMLAPPPDWCTDYWYGRRMLFPSASGPSLRISSTNEVISCASLTPSAADAQTNLMRSGSMSQALKRSPQQVEAAQCLVVLFEVVTFAGVTARDHHAVCSAGKGLAAQRSGRGVPSTSGGSGARWADTSCELSQPGRRRGTSTSCR